MQSLCGGTEAIKYRRAVLTRMCDKPSPRDRRQTAVRARHTATHGTMPSHPRPLW